MPTLPCVLHAATSSGGVLLDVDNDRFVALSKLSSAIWCALRDKDERTALMRIRDLTGVAEPQAGGLLRRQIRLWTEAGLLPEATGQVTVLHRSKSEASKELPAADTLSAELRIGLMTRIVVTELQYRRRVKRYGFGQALRTLQAEHSRFGASEDHLKRILRAYYAGRRLYKQGIYARDCLHRSLALAAVLRRHGFDACLCIGVTDLPFNAHAWVETNGFIVNETLEKRQRFETIGRF